MAKPELGTKRVCPVTGKKFYDLNKNPVISPYTGQVVPIETVVARGGRPEPVRAAVPEEAEAPEAQEARDAPRGLLRGRAAEVVRDRSHPREQLLAGCLPDLHGQTLSSGA